MSAHTTALLPTLRLIADFHRGQPIDKASARQSLQELRDACFDGLRLLASLSLSAAQLHDLSEATVREAAYLQALLAELGSECGAWLNELER
ncbi:hypothetical protein HZU77_000035 [Neisseriaceae bacterium TC5R-5]|nr:hypothetical protein [Neisseriaceae bacterium TC5R-5]